MNYDLAMMALEGLSKAPARVLADGGVVRVDASSAGFKELARLCLLLGSQDVAIGETFELKSPAHLAKGSASLVLTLSK